MLTLMIPLPQNSWTRAVREARVSRPMMICILSGYSLWTGLISKD